MLILHKTGDAEPRCWCDGNENVSQGVREEVSLQHIL